MPRMPRPKTPIVQPAARARALTVQAAQRASRARIELAVVIPLIAGFLAALPLPRAGAGDRHARARRHGDRAGDPRLAPRARHRALAGARAVPAHGPATAGTVGFIIRLSFLIAAVLVALQHRRAGAADARRVRRHRRGRVRPRRPADAGQPDRGRRAHLRAAVQGRRPRAAAVRPPRRRARGRRRLARPALHDLRPRRRLDHGPEQHRARGRGRAAARALGRRPPRAAAPGRHAEPGPGAARRGHHARRSAPSRTSASRRSTRTRSSSGSRRPPPRTPTGRASRTRSSPRSRRSPARARRRSASPRAATTSAATSRSAAGPAGHVTQDGLAAGPAGCAAVHARSSGVLANVDRAQARPVGDDALDRPRRAAEPRLRRR